MEPSLTINPSRPPEVLTDQSRLYLLALIRRLRSIADGETFLMRDVVANVPCRPVEAEVLRELLIRAPALGSLSVAAFVAAWDQDGASMLSAGGRLAESPVRTRTRK
jgi:hypothetical protein